LRGAPGIENASVKKEKSKSGRRAEMRKKQDREALSVKREGIWEAAPRPVTQKKEWGPEECYLKKLQSVAKKRKITTGPWARQGCTKRGGGAPL